MLQKVSERKVLFNRRLVRCLKKRYFFYLRLKWIFRNFEFVYFLDFKVDNVLDLDFKSLSFLNNFGFLKCNARNILGMFSNNFFFNFLKGEFYLLYFKNIESLKSIKDKKFLEFYDIFGVIYKSNFINNIFISNLWAKNEIFKNNFIIFKILFKYNFIIFAKIIKLIKLRLIKSLLNIKVL